MSAKIKGNVLTVNGVKTHVSNQEIAILWVMMARKYVTTDKLAEIMWPHPDNMPDTFCNLINVRLCALRKKLEPSEWRIVKHYGRPFELVRID